MSVHVGRLAARVILVTVLGCRGDPDAGVGDMGETGETGETGDTSAAEDAGAFPSDCGVEAQQRMVACVADLSAWYYCLQFHECPGQSGCQLASCEVPCHQQWRAQRAECTERFCPEYGDAARAEAACVNACLDDKAECLAGMETDVCGDTELFDCADAYEDCAAACPITTLPPP